jgi:geranylgeranyl diphosphate synthase, type I
LTLHELGLIIEERGNRIREKFSQEVIRGVDDSTLSGILKLISDNKKDSFRPALTSLSCEAVGGPLEAADDAGLMFSLVSTGVSIHDDIIDKSPRKHLRITLLGKYGLNKSLLVGDLLIVKGWAKISDMLAKNLNPAKIAKIAKIYGDLCAEMCEAEFMENCCRKKTDTELEHHKKILWKAMAETEACTRIGAIFGEGSDEEVRVLSEFGRRLGFTSRLADEIKDSLNINGNLIHRLKYESVPLPLLFAAKSSKRSQIKIESIIRKADFQPSNIRSLLELCFECDAFNYVRKTAEENMNAAARCLDKLKPSFSRNILSHMNEKFYGEVTAICC